MQKLQFPGLIWINKRVKSIHSLANKKARISIDFDIAAARCNESKNVKIYREQHSTNQIEGFGSRDQN